MDVDSALATTFSASTTISLDATSLSSLPAPSSTLPGGSSSSRVLRFPTTISNPSSPTSMSTFLAPSLQSVIDIVHSSLILDPSHNAGTAISSKDITNTASSAFVGASSSSASFVAFSLLPSNPSSSSEELESSYPRSSSTLPTITTLQTTSSAPPINSEASRSSSTLLNTSSVAFSSSGSGSLPASSTYS